MKPVLPLLAASLLFAPLAHAQESVPQYHSQRQAYGVLDIIKSSSSPLAQKQEAMKTLAALYAQAPHLGQRALPALAGDVTHYIQAPTPENTLNLAMALMTFKAGKPQENELVRHILTPLAASSPLAALLLQYMDAPFEDDLIHKLQNAAQTPAEKSFAFMALARQEDKQGRAPLALLYGAMALKSFYSVSMAEEIASFVSQGRPSTLHLTGKREADLSSLRNAMTNAFPQEFQRLFILASATDLLNPPVEDHAILPSTEPIHICIGFDNNYAPHAAVTMLSAMLSAKPTTRYVFHVLQDKQSVLSDSNKQKFEEMMKMLPGDRFHVTFEVFNTDIIDPVVLENGHKSYWTPIILFKMYMQDFYKDLDKIMWLDSDIIVRDDLSEFYNTDMQGHWLLGTRDVNADKILKEMGANVDDTYLNVGLVVFDNKAIRDNQGIKKIEKLFAENPDLNDILVCPEQDIFALAYKGKLLEVEYQDKQGNRWNWNQLKPLVPTHWNSVHSIDAAVVHLMSPSLKPWAKISRYTRWQANPKDLGGLALMYWSIRQMTPWAMVEVE